MKKFVFTLLLLIAGQVIYAQDLNQLMNDLSKVEGVQKQVMDKAMLQQMGSGMPAFMSKADSVVAVIAQSCPQDMIDRLNSGLKSAEANKGYETLMSVKKENNTVSILLSKNGSDTKDIFICVMGAGGATVFVKMAGNFTAEDIENIVKEQENSN